MKHFRSTALALAGALAVAGAQSVAAAPVLGNTAALQQAAPSQTTDVQWRRHGHGGRGAGAFVAGAATGLIVGGALAAASQPRYGYYEPGYVYEPAPRYYAPGPTYYEDSYAYEPPPVYRAPRRGVGSSSVGCRGSSTGTVGLDATAC